MQPKWKTNKQQPHWLRLWLKVHQMAFLWANLCTKEAPCHFPNRLTALTIITVLWKWQTIAYKTISGPYLLDALIVPPNSMVTNEFFFIATEGTPSTAWHRTPSWAQILPFLHLYASPEPPVVSPFLRLPVVATYQCQANHWSQYFLFK